MSSRTVSIVALSLALAAGLIAGYASVFSGGLPRRVIDTPPKDTSDDTDSNLLSTGNPFDKIDNRLNDLEQCCEQTETGLTDVFQSIETINENAFFVCDDDDPPLPSNVPCHVYECVQKGDSGDTERVLRQAASGTACEAEPNKFGHCSASGDCVLGQGCTDVEPFLGWFQDLVHSPLFLIPVSFEGPVPTIFESTLRFCNESHFGLSMRRLIGNVEFAREPNDFDFILVPSFEFTGSGRILVEDRNFESEYLSLNLLNFTFGGVLQTASELNGYVLLSGLNIPTFDSEAGFYHTHVLAPLQQSPPDLRPYPDDVSFPDAENPVLQVEQFVAFVKNILPFFSKSLLSDTGVDQGGFDDLFEEIRQHDIEQPVVTVTEILPSRNHGPVTLIEPETYMRISPASHIEISGLTNAWASLNGEWPISTLVSYSQYVNRADDDVYYAQDTNKFRFLVAFDSTGYPEYDSLIHGTATVTTRVHRLRNTATYRELIDVLWYLLISVFPLGTTHDRLDFIGTSRFSGPSEDAPIVAQTFEEAQSIVLSEFFGAHQFGITRYGGHTASALPVLPTFGRSRAVNEPFEELTDTIPGTYKVTLNNYILAESVRYMWFRVDPQSPVTTPAHSSFLDFLDFFPNYNAYVAATSQSGLLPPGKPEGGSRLEPILSQFPYTTGNGTNPVTGNVDVTDAQGNFMFASPWSFSLQDYVGIIDPALVGGRRIGYLRLRDVLQTDFAELGLLPEFSINQQTWPAVELYCSYIKYLNEYDFGSETGVESIIVDIRENAGGYLIFPFGFCFGGDRAGSEIVMGVPNQLNRPPINFGDLDFFARNSSGTPSSIQSSLFEKPILPSVASSIVPNGVFNNGTVIVLTSISAFSGADFVPWLFAGDAGDGQLGSLQSGSSVKAYTVGNLHGFSHGTQFGFQVFSPDISGIAPQLGLPGFPFPTFFYAPEGSGTLESPFGVPTTRRRFPNGTAIPGLAPVCSSLPNSPLYNQSRVTPTPVAGIGQRALSGEFGDVSYYDYGYLGPGSGFNGFPYSNGHWDSVAQGGPTGLTQRASGFPDQPELGDPATWRDSWFEEALRVAQIHSYGNYDHSGHVPQSSATSLAVHNAAVARVQAGEAAAVVRGQAFQDFAKAHGDDLDWAEIKFLNNQTYAFEFEAYFKQQQST